MSVPIARRQLLTRPGRTAAGIAGLAVALLLVLALRAIFAGMEGRITAVIDQSGADVIVAQAGVDTIHMSESVLPDAAAEAIAAVPGVARARPVLLTTTMVERDERRGLAYLVGEERPGSVIQPVRGRPPGTGEIVIDEALADDLGVGVGSAVVALGGTFRVAGELEDTVSLTNSVALVRRSDLAGLLRAEGIVNYVFVDASPGVGAGGLAARINRGVPGVQATAGDDFARAERRLVGDMTTDIVRAMIFVGFIIGVAVAGLVAYSSTLQQLRDYAVLRALGLRARRALAIVLSQLGATVALGFALALVLTVALSALLPKLNAALVLTIRLQDVAEALVVAGAVAALAAAVPVLRVARIDPASVFRR